jgi:hypothetical protein
MHRALNMWRADARKVDEVTESGPLEDFDCTVEIPRVCMLEIILERSRAKLIQQAWRARPQREKSMLAPLNSLEGLVAPIGLESTADKYFPALCDDGASLKVSCSRTLDGAVLSTFERADAGDLKVGESTARLSSLGSYIYVYERNGSDGSAETVVRRMKHTPTLHINMVISEPTEVYTHEYEFKFTKNNGRVMTTPDQRQVPLYMSAAGLGWLRVRPVTDPTRQAAAMAEAQPSVMAIGGGENRSVGMSKYHTNLRGVELLRREHVRHAHPAIGKLVRTLKAEGSFGTLISKEDVEQYPRPPWR